MKLMDHAVNCGHSKLHAGLFRQTSTASIGANRNYAHAVVVSVPVALSTDSYLTEFVLWV